MAKNPPYNAGATGDVVFIPGTGRSPGGGNGSPRQDSCLGNPMERGAWWAAVQGVGKGQTGGGTERAHNTRLCLWPLWTDQTRPRHTHGAACVTGCFRPLLSAVPLCANVSICLCLLLMDTGTISRIWLL